MRHVQVKSLTPFRSTALTHSFTFSIFMYLRQNFRRQSGQFVKIEMSHCRNLCWIEGCPWRRSKLIMLQQNLKKTIGGGSSRRFLLILDHFLAIFDSIDAILALDCSVSLHD